MKNKTHIFFSNQITANKDNIIVSTDPYLYVLDFKTGATISKKLITSITKPILSKNGLYVLVTSLEVRYIGKQI